MKKKIFMKAFKIVLPRLLSMFHWSLRVGVNVVELWAVSSSLSGQCSGCRRIQWSDLRNGTGADTSGELCIQSQFDAFVLCLAIRETLGFLIETVLYLIYNLFLKAYYFSSPIFPVSEEAWSTPFCNMIDEGLDHAFDRISQVGK